MTDYVINNRTGEVHEANCPRVRVLASPSPWDPAKAALTPGVYADRICLHGQLPLRAAPVVPTLAEAVESLARHYESHANVSVMGRVYRNIAGDLRDLVRNHA